MAERERKIAGNFRASQSNILDFTFSDLENPWNFFRLFMREEAQVNEWCRKNGLLVTQLPCTSKKKNGSRSSEGEKCNGNMVLRESAARTGGEILRCTKNRNHQKAMRVNSFFEGSTLTIPDCMLFIKSYLDKLTLLQCSRFVGIAYGTTAVNWGSFVREVFKEHFYRNTRFKKLSGTVEIDESLFGKRTKYHRGNPHGGMKVWIFGMVERESNTIIIYPVADRTAGTLIPLIQRHVEPGTTIYSDGWTAYCDLNDLGYRHFTVLHKYSFKKVYRNVTTGVEEVVCTNQIEGAWKHAKEHFRRMSGTKVRQFEGHLAEIMWRSEKKGNLYGGFFETMKTIFTLESAPDYQYTTPLFDSWTMDADSTVAPVNTDAEISTSEAESDDTEIPPNRFRETPLSSIKSTTTDEIAHDIIGSDTSPLSSAASTRVLRAASRGTSVNPPIVISSSSADEADKTLTEPGPSTSGPSTSGPSKAKSKVSLKKKRGGSPKSKVTSKKEKICAPVGFEPVNIVPEPSKKEKRKSNPYSKSAFVWASDDDDFM
ncbi:uncharacterized protein LOC134255960 [Saccostrea cucullata]|uniref:uncharacterized protein LOC134255960 n=1 Tax=Saccostrea cuccullata TaxID=36930 RepID=UPI002ED46117